MPAAINIILADPIKLVEDDIISQIAGNAPREIKEIPLKWLALFRSRKNSFANPITSRVKIVEVSVIQNPEDQQRTEGRVVCEIDVTEDMLSRSGVMDEGCAVLLIDEYGLPTCYLCSVCSLATLCAIEGRDTRPGVSQAINTVFHHPAQLGAKLRIVNTSMAGGGEMSSCRSEIWDIEQHRLVASGVQLQMMPSKPMRWISPL